MHLRFASSLRIAFAAAFASLPLALATPALADEAAPAPPPSLPAPTVVAPAPGQAAASAPSHAAVPITATCTLGDHPGIEEDEARTGADVVCHELAKERATNTQHEVRFGKLGGRTLVTVASREGNGYDERRTLLGSMDELPVAAPRLAGSLSSGRSLEETRNVDNVLAAEAQASKVQRGQMGFDGGVFGLTGVGAQSGASGGVHLGLLYRAGSFGISSHGRAAGIGSGETKIGAASWDIGGRVYLSNGEVSPFLGVGFELAYFKLNRGDGPDVEGSGFGAFGQVGLELLRTHHAAMSTSLRVDAPFYALSSASQEAYVAPVSLNVGLVFH